MKYADVDTNEGYWGDDDLTRDDGSESDPATSSGRSSRSEKRMPDATMSTPPSGTQRGFGLNTPSGEARPASQTSNFEGSTTTAMSLASSRFTANSSPPRHPPPNTPQSRKVHIKEAFKATSPYPPSPSQKKSIRQIAVFDEDIGEEREVSMILTDTEPGPESPTTSSSSTSWTLSLPEDTFSSVSPLYSYRTPTRREAKSTSPTKKNPIPERAITPPGSEVNSYMSFSEAFYTPKKTPSLPARSGSMPTVGTSSSTKATGLFNMSLDSTLRSKFIAHDDVVQKDMDALGISWGVQYELARGVNSGKWKWPEVTHEKLQQLTGSNADSAYRVHYVMLNRPVTKKADLALWQELDREQAAIMENEGRALGLKGRWKGDHDWHGGRIQQLARLYLDGDVYIKLEPMEMRRSHRFARYCGSRRILQVRIPDDIRDNDFVRKSLCNKFVLCGRSFVPFHAKEGSVYMVEIADNLHRRPKSECGDQFRLTFSQFINWHNPLLLNKGQPVSKYASRFALGLSNSIPVIEFEANCIEFIHDEIAADWDRSRKPPSDKIMTDGCGFINRAAMMAITRKMKYGSRPTAVQGRVGGAKGLWILDPSYDSDERPRIWIRDSQNKIKYANLEDRSHRILELLCVSQPPNSIALSEQTILNLYFNGIPEETLVELLEQGIQHDAAPLMEWEEPMPLLWHAINKAGHVTGSRAARLAVGRSRALGLSRQEWGPQWVNNDDILSDEQPGDDLDSMDVDGEGAYTGRNQYSGAPLGLHESALELVQAGFTPMEFKVLHDKIRYIMMQIIDSAVQKYHIPLQESISALVVPDPLGVLEEGQIYFKSSQVMLDPATATTFNVLKGKVLVGRYPVRLASDIQKVTAVDIMELSDWSDVIIVSTKGERSAANILSGGDYDGDELFVIRESCLVEPFKNQPLIPEPPNLQQECFQAIVESVEQLSQRSLEEGEMQLHFHHELLSGLNDAKVGLYSRFHEYSIYRFGYSAEETIRIAYMFTITLDSGKTGLRLKPEVFNEHRRKFMGDVGENFILGNLVAAGRKKGDVLLQQYDKSQPRDDSSHLKEPWDKAWQKARRFDEAHRVTACQAAMESVSKHVDEVYRQWCAVCAKPKVKEGKTRQKKRQRRSRNGEEDAMLKVAAKFHERLDVDLVFDDVEVLKTSYAARKNIRFALSVAFNLVCQIKAKASPDGYASCVRIFDEMKSMGPSSLRALAPPEE